MAEDAFTPLPADRRYSAGNGPLSSYVEHLFAIREESGKFFVRFDLNGLAKLITPPRFFLGEPAVEAASAVDASRTIRVNRTHFTAYMSVLLNHGVFLHEGQHQRLYPIAFHGERAIQQSTVIDFAIDCSGSMRSVFPRLKQMLTDVVNALPRTLDPHATRIRIAPFSSHDAHFPASEFLLHERPAIIAAINSLSDPIDTHQTALYKFLVQQFQFFRTLTDVNVVCVLISDGGDNDSQEKYKPNATESDRLSITLRVLGQAVSPPKFFSLEIGTLTEHVLETIKQKTAGTRIQVGSTLDNFTAFSDHLSQLGMIRLFLHFIQEARQFRLPVVGRTNYSSSRP